MTTTNVALTTAWTKLADTGDSPVLISQQGINEVEYATTVSGAPSAALNGHLLKSTEAITRAVLGTGEIYARIVPRHSSPTSANIIVTK